MVDQLWVARAVGGTILRWRSVTFRCRGPGRYTIRILRCGGSKISRRRSSINRTRPRRWRHTGSLGVWIAPKCRRLPQLRNFEYDYNGNNIRDVPIRDDLSKSVRSRNYSTAESYWTPARNILGLLVGSAKSRNWVSAANRSVRRYAICRNRGGRAYHRLYWASIHRSEWSEHCPWT